VLQETGLDPRYLELEVTETLLLANAEVTVSIIQELKATRLTLAIDDFGTGYSSFSYLRQFQADRLKIDRSLSEMPLRILLTQRLSRQSLAWQRA
jgi:EAL domain-containing protein (putative c-di-GMP-specific phosphodiesterase class I)